MSLVTKADGLNGKKTGKINNFSKTFANLHNLEAGEKLANDKGGRADNVERDNDQGQLDSLDLGPGYNHRGRSEQKRYYQDKNIYESVQSSLII